MHKHIWLAMLFNLFEAFKMYKKNVPREDTVKILPVKCLVHYELHNITVHWQKRN